MDAAEQGRPRIQEEAAVRRRDDAWTVEAAAAYLSAHGDGSDWDVARVRERIRFGGGHNGKIGHLRPARGEPPNRALVRYVTRTSVLRYARLLASADQA
jgi:hypothetical protein